jgi:hypothetical protein
VNNIRQQRKTDMALLTEVLDQPLAEVGEKWHDDELRPDESTAFSDMLDSLNDSQAVLTKKQREWIMNVAERMGLSVVRLHADEVPRGKEVPMPEVLQNLPKSPPRRRMP